MAKSSAPDDDFDMEYDESDLDTEVDTKEEDEA